jgi:hypothetical protein
MTGNDMPTHSGLPPGPPWPLDLLADLHAGVLDPPDADALRRRAESDPESRATLAALDTTARTLASLPRPRMPEDVVARIDAALAREAASTAAGRPSGVDTGTAPRPPTVSLATERARRRRGLITGITGAGILAAAAVAAAFAVVNLTRGATNGQPTAGLPPLDTQSSISQSGPGTEPLALSSGNLGEALDDALGATEYGPLASASRLAGCLGANGIDPIDAVPVGAKQITLDGKPGVLIVLPAGSNPPKWRLLVVGPECGPNNPATLASTTIG